MTMMTLVGSDRRSRSRRPLALTAAIALVSMLPPLERIRDSRRSAAEDGWTRDGTAHRATTQPTDRPVP